MFNKALILVDLENEWIDKNSDYFIGDISALIQKTNQLIDYYGINNFVILRRRHGIL